MERGGASTDAARSQLQALTDLQRQIAGAGPTTLSSLRGEIVAVTAASRALAQQGRAASNAESAEIALATASVRTRATVQRIAGDLFERRIFDPYLRFDSPEEEAEYRRREAERQEYIRRELARGTPEGNLNAANATLAQIDDAGAHGADRSPEYSRARTSILNARNEQQAAIQGAGLASQELETPAPQQRDPSSIDLDEIAAVFRAAGVQPPPAETTQRSGHGLTDLAMERGGGATIRYT